jgi:hypothetical protein
VERIAASQASPLALSPQFDQAAAAASILNRIFESNTLRIMFIEPPLRRFFASEHLRIVDVANVSGCPDVDPDSFHRSLGHRRFRFIEMKLPDWPRRRRLSG